MKRGQLKQKTPLKAKQPLRAGKLSSKKKKVDPDKKVPNKGYKPPKWFNRIKYGSHGSTPAQKRLWKVVSDLLRQEDYERNDGRCSTCFKKLERWQDGHAAHYRKYSLCKSWFKFEIKNLALSCPICNKRDDGPIGHEMGKHLERKYGKGHLEWILKENDKYAGVKMETWEIVEKVKEIAPHLVDWEEENEKISSNSLEGE